MVLGLFVQTELVIYSAAEFAANNDSYTFMWVTETSYQRVV